MTVYNLTSHPVVFRGSTIEPDGSKDFPELDRYLTQDDKKLEAENVLSFGFLPAWYRTKKE